nr:NADH dehydrogenase subunit 2 [Aclees taiwanensis]
MKKLYKLMFYSTMITSTIISISALSWFTAWIGLEINLLSIMPLMKQLKNTFSSESTIKYFIIQAMASSLLLFSIIIFTNSKEYSIELTMSISMLMNSALLLKMGAAPFHFWFPEVISGLNWEMAYILMTWQKIAPMILLSYSTYMPSFLAIIIILSSLISGIQGINQTCIRKILAYSSINHVSWMISALLNSMTIWLYYFLIYSIINTNIIIILSKYNIFFTSQLSKLFSFNKKLKFLFMLNFLSLGGLPPFLGFFPKWLVINFMVMNNLYSIAIILIIFTLLLLYMYIRVTFSSFSINSEESLIKNFNKISFIHFMTNLISLMGLIICTIFTNML